YVKSLRLQKNRLESKRFVVEGKKPVMELIQAGFTIEAIYVQSELQLEELGHNVEEVSETDMKQLSDLSTPPGILAVAHLPEWYPEVKSPLELSVDKGILVLDGIRDPGNLGTIIRTADWFGHKAILATSDTVDCFNQKVVQASMGSVFRVQVLYLSDVQLDELRSLDWYGLDLGGQSLYETKPKSGLYVIGNESHGIRAAMRERIQTYLHIPGAGKAESLNAAVSAAILMNELYRS
ncbi:MAG: hypothetical protein RL226_1029, partial [Bacteroidota bacterium]